jgi:hypothetical protein
MASRCPPSDPRARGCACCDAKAEPAGLGEANAVRRSAALSVDQPAVKASAYLALLSLPLDACWAFRSEPVSL